MSLTLTVIVVIVLVVVLLAVLGVVMSRPSELRPHRQGSRRQRLGRRRRHPR